MSLWQTFFKARLHSFFVLSMLLPGLAGCGLFGPKQVSYETYTPRPRAYSAQEDPLARQAAHYAAFLSDLRSIEELAPKSSKDLDSVFTRLTVYNGRDLGQGFTAFCSIIAAQNTKFVDAVRQKAGVMGRDALIKKLYTNPDFIWEISGNRDALRDIHRQITGHAEHFYASGLQYKEHAYALQKVKWAKKRLKSPNKRLKILKSTKGNGPKPDRKMVEALAVGALGQAEGNHDKKRALFKQTIPFTHTQSETVSFKETLRKGGTYESALVLGALMALDATTPKDKASFAPFMSRYDGEFCFDFARSNLTQCIAASAFEYEDSFCISEHIMKDAAKCIRKAAH